MNKTVVMGGRRSGKTAQGIHHTFAAPSYHGVGFQAIRIKPMTANVIMAMQDRFGVRILPHIKPFLAVPVTAAQIKQRGLVKDPGLGYENIYVTKGN